MAEQREGRFTDNVCVKLESWFCFQDDCHTPACLLKCNTLQGSNWY